MFAFLFPLGYKEVGNILARRYKYIYIYIPYLNPQSPEIYTCGDTNSESCLRKDALPKEEKWERSKYFFWRFFVEDNYWTHTHALYGILMCIEVGVFNLFLRPINRTLKMYVVWLYMAEEVIYLMVSSQPRNSVAKYIKCDWAEL